MKKLLFLVLSVLSLQQLSAQSMWKYFSADDFAARRKKVMEKIGDGIAILQGADLPEAFVKFRQDNNFYYLSGVEVPGAMMIIDGKQKRSVLLVPDDIPGDIKEEAIIKPGEAAAKEYKFDMVVSKTNAVRLIYNLVGSGREVYICSSAEETTEMSRDRCLQIRFTRMADIWDGRISKEVNFRNKITQNYPAAVIKDLTPILDDMRWIKDEKEIAVLRECGRIGCLGINEAIKVTRPGIYEYQTVAACDFIYENMGTSFPAYFPIAASGERGLSWHYNANNHLLEAGTVLLIDYAPELNYYTTDITRTWPVSEKFTDQQLKFYECLLDARNSIIAAMKPGVNMEDLKEIGKNVYKKHGMEKYWNGYVGHLVGMAVHDVGDRNKTFVPGVVFNVEPILEDKDLKIHFRLEDTILITATGAENLTNLSPVNAKDIYAMMKEKGVGE